MSKSYITTIKEFMSNGYKCVITRVSYDPLFIRNLDYYDISGRSWWYCGYVYIPKGDKYYNAVIEDMEHVNNFIHGNITLLEKDDDYNVICFDCNHMGDDDNINSLDFIEPHLIAVTNILRYGNEDN